MKLELQRMKNNFLHMYIIILCLLCGILGVFLLISLDKYTVNEIPQGLLQYSIYTVYTQFGYFIFPIFSMSLISTDYREKNITFYKVLGYNPHSYFLCKACAILLFITVGNAITSIIVSLAYGNFSNIFLFALKLENISIFISLISLFYAYLFKKIIVSYCVNFAIWVGSIVISTMNGFFEYLCFYDATWKRHRNMEQVFKSNVFMHSSVFIEIFYNVIALLIILLIICIFRKMWTKNGI
jgi:putative peptide transport system permease protein